ncbi:MAG: tRNA pseudouridine(55) synthase TruB [bacterium]|nr:tRNA pseudouridine(55) synthase TruB [bacterium]MDT8395501.1 tRNA pseudouridine(55) synthase TruB [bacterium]
MKRAAKLGFRRKKTDNRISVHQGILVVDKPVGLTSHDVVQKVRKVFGTRQVGHAGTLDPIASGVLVLLVGSATRIAQYLQEDDKEYHLTLRLGMETDTQDITGQILSGADPSGVGREELEKALAAYRGQFKQVPPSFSAVKRAGQPLYRLARKGVRIEVEPREVQIRRLDLTGWDPPVASLQVVCSKGTYMRTLCHDIGRDLGVGGCMESLVRFSSGAFPLEEAVSLDQVTSDPEPARWLRAAAGGLRFPSVELADEALIQLAGGKDVPCPNGIRKGLVSITRKGRLIAVATVRSRDGEQYLGPIRVLEPNLKELLKQTDK